MKQTALCMIFALGFTVPGRAGVAPGPGPAARAAPSSDELVRRRRAALGMGRSPSALAKALKDDDVIVRRIATCYAARVHQSRIASYIDVLLGALKDDDPRVRGNAATALHLHFHWYDSHLPHKSMAIVEAMTSLLDDEHYYPRLAACRTLKHGAEWANSAVPALAGTMKDEGLDVRVAAAVALVTIVKTARDKSKPEAEADQPKEPGGKDTAELLERAARVLVEGLRVEDYEPRLEAIEALRRCGVVPRDIVEAIGEAQWDPNGGTGWDASQVLLKMRRPSAAAVKALLLRASWRHAGKGMAESLPGVVARLEAADAAECADYLLEVLAGNVAVPSEKYWGQADRWRARVLAAQCLGALGGPTREVIEALSKAAADDDERVAAAAAEALKKLRAPGGEPSQPARKDSSGEKGN